MGLLNAFNCPVLSLLAHSAICPKLQSASLCHLPQLSLFPLVFPLLYSVLCFILPPALLCPLTHSCHLPHYSMSSLTLCSLFHSALCNALLCHLSPFSLCSTLPSASLCPLLHSDFCSNLTSAPHSLLQSDLFSSLISAPLCPLLHYVLSHSALFFSLTFAPL